MERARLSLEIASVDRAWPGQILIRGVNGHELPAPVPAAAIGWFAVFAILGVLIPGLDWWVGVLLVAPIATVAATALRPHGLPAHRIAGPTIAMHARGAIGAARAHCERPRVPVLRGVGARTVGPAVVRFALPTRWHHRRGRLIVTPHPEGDQDVVHVLLPGERMEARP